MTSSENLPAHVQEAVDTAMAEIKRSVYKPVVMIAVTALHRAKLLAGDRACRCNSPSSERGHSHQCGDEAFCQDSFREAQ